MIPAIMALLPVWTKSRVEILPNSLPAVFAGP
jgi:hypothetical protein